MNKAVIIWTVWVLMLVLGLSGCASGGAPQPVYPTFQLTEDSRRETPEPVGPRQITSNTLGLREYWRTPIQFLAGEADNPNLQAISGRVVYAEYDGMGIFNYIRTRRAANGELLWEVSMPDVGTLIVDTERVYHRENHCKLRAYDLAEGSLLWEQDIQGKTCKPSHMFVEGEKLYLRLPVNEDCEFDARTGEYLNMMPRLLNDGVEVLASFPSFTLITGTSGDYWSSVQAIGVDTKQTLWIADVGARPIARKPELSNSTLLLGDDEVFAIDPQTGQSKWHRYLASNYVIVDNSIYALDYDARLVRLDVKTGEETGYVQFTPASTGTPDGHWSAYYWIAVDGQMLFVSFGDTHELIALGP